MSNQGLSVPRHGYHGPVPLPDEVGFAPIEAEGRPKLLTVEEVITLGEPDDGSERELFTALADGTTWIARLDMGVRCPGCRQVYRDRPAIKHLADIRSLMGWDGRVYDLGPLESHPGVLRWIAWFQHDQGCTLPVVYAITEGQVLAWTDAYGPWHHRNEP